MAENRIRPVVMPTWGLSMKEGKLTGWLKRPGERVAVGDELLEVETDKIANVVEAGDAGTLRRTIGEPQTVYPVKALLGVLAEEDVSDSEIDAFVASYVTPAADAEDDEEAGPRYERAELDLGALRYARRGESGPAVLLIHGFGGDLDNWLFNIDALAAGASVYALDLPGHGQSVKSLVEPTVGGLTKAVLAFMDKVGIDAAHLVGHSMGGAIAMRIAAEAPQRVRSLALIAPAGLGAEVNREYLDGFVATTSRRELKPVVETLFADKSLVTRQLLENLLKYKRIDGVGKTLRTLAQDLTSGSSAPALPSTLPVLVIRGKEDRVIPGVGSDALGSNARSEVIAGAGHMVQMEAAREVNALLREHLGAAAQAE